MSANAKLQLKQIQLEVNDIRIAELEEKISNAQKAYYNNMPIFSDKAYDTFLDQLAFLSPKNKLLFQVGTEPVSNWEKHIHTVPMLSLDKAQTNEVYIKWHNKYVKANDEVFVTLKLDGLSVSLEYEDGKLIRGVTRGSGVSGEIITSNVIKMTGVPLRLTQKVNATVRGEILLSKENHLKYFPDYSNPRNAASGICRRYDGENCDKLSILCYELDCEQLKCKSYEESFITLIDLGFNPPPFYMVKTAQEVIQLKDDFQASMRDQFSMLLDGMVIHLNDLAKWQEYGYNEHHPYASIAFKFEAPAKETTVKEIVCQVGNSGRITPVAIFTEKVELAGAEIERASLHNFGNIEDLGIDVGSKVIVSRRNDVIPYVEEVTESTGTVFQAPTHCPICGAKTQMLGEYLICPNSLTCPAQLSGRIKNWVSTLNLLEWGEAIINKLIESGKVTTVADLYKLTEEDLLSLDRMGEKSAKKVLDILNSNKNISIEKFLGGLSFPMVGETMIGLVSGAGYDTIDKIRAMTVDDLLDIPRIGEAKAQSLFNGMKDYSEVIDALIAAGVTVKELAGVLKNKSFCFTGTMVNKRPVLAKMVTDNGGTVAKSISKGVDYLVTADQGTTKTIAAKKLGITQISENDFLAMVHT